MICLNASAGLFLHGQDPLLTFALIVVSLPDGSGLIIASIRLSIRGNLGTKFLNSADLEHFRDGLRKAGLATARAGNRK
jgi:hypothetical protein